MVTVLWLWPPEAELKELLTAKLSGSVRLVFPPDDNPVTLVRLAAEAAVVVGWRISPELLAVATKLELVIVPGAGVWETVQTIRKSGRPILLVNDHGNARAVAQHAVALLLALTNRIVQYHNRIAAGNWRVDDRAGPSRLLSGRRVGLLGYGHVNRLVHRLLAGFGPNFAIVRRQWPDRDEGLPTPAERLGPDGVDRLFETSDIVMVSLPLTDETAGLVDYRRLELLGGAGLLVNYARGAVVVEADLYRALRDRVIAGAAVDVWYSRQTERDGVPQPYHFPFHELDNVVLSPHRAASPFFTPERWNEVIENIRRFATGRRDLLNLVDIARGY